MAIATVEDVQARFSRELTDDERTMVQARLEDVEAIIKTRIPDLDERIANGELSRDLVVMVESEAVLRVVRNPEGYSQETDGNYSYSMASGVASGRVTITDEEWALLGVHRGAFTIRPRVAVPERRWGPEHWRCL